MTFATDLSDLKDMLAYRRPAGCKTERRFINDVIRPLGVHHDRAGNLIKRVGKPEDSPILWSCHTDTVSHAGGMQRLTASNGVIRVNDKTSNCLGADDTAGVWLLRELIKANVPGLYVFHRGEEIGGIGSKFIAKTTPDLLKGIETAIAIDRMGNSNVITHQGSRCCSDEFAFTLAGQLNKRSGFRYEASDEGLFTDTANYTDLVGECTNLSCGYYDAHSDRERLDFNHLARLRDALIEMDHAKLEFTRKPGEVDPHAYDAWGGFSRRFQGRPSWLDDDDPYASNNWHGGYLERSAIAEVTGRDGWQREPIDVDAAMSKRDLTRLEMVKLIREYPEAAAEVLLDLGITIDDLLEEAYDHRAF